MCKFEFYVLNWDFNEKKIINFNIFQNIRLQESAEAEVKKYLRDSKNYSVIKSSYKDDENSKIYGFPAFCERLRQLIMWQEWSRCEYEIAVGDAFEKDCNKLEKWDCYGQCIANIPMITREVIWQYKQQLKGEKDESIKE